MFSQLEKKKQENKMRRDQLNDEYLELLDKQRLYFKTVKDFKEVRKLMDRKTFVLSQLTYLLRLMLNCLLVGVSEKRDVTVQAES